MALESHERETCLGFDNSGPKCQLTTFNKTLIKQLDNYCIEFPKEYKKINDIYVDDILEGKEYTFPKKLVTIRKPTKTKMTERQKKEVAERLKKSRKTKENK